MTDTLPIWLFIGLVILTVLVVIWQALEVYQVRKIKRLIDYASTKLTVHLTVTPSEINISDKPDYIPLHLRPRKPKQ